MLEMLQVLQVRQVLLVGVHNELVVLG